MKKIIFIFFTLFCLTAFAQDSIPAPVTPVPTSLMTKIDSAQAAAQKWKDAATLLAVALGDTNLTKINNPNQFAALVQSESSKWKVSSIWGKVLICIAVVLGIFFAFTQWHIPGALRGLIKIFGGKATLILLLFGLFALSGCKSTRFIQQAATYLQTKCPHTTVTLPDGQVDIHYECDSLWPTGPVSNHCSKVTICIDAAKGSISGDVNCGDTSLTNIFNSLKPVAK